MKSDFGNIRRIGKNSWQIRYLTKDPDDPGHKTIRGDEEDAKFELQKKKNEFYGIHGGDWTVNEMWYDVYHSSTRYNKKKATTRTSYDSYYRNHIEPKYGNRRIDGITAMEVQDWLFTKTQSVAKHTLAVMRVLFAAASSAGAITANPLRERFELPKKSDHPECQRHANDGIYTEKELLNLLERCSGEPFELMVTIMGGSGCRRCECFGLKRNAVRFVERNGETYGIGTIDTDVVNNRGRIVVTDTKNERSERSFIIIPPFAERLRELMGALPQENEWMFDDGKGNPIDPEEICRSYKNWSHRQSMRYIPPKNLRNTYATMMHSHGLDMKTVADLLGHSSHLTTEAFYDKPTSDMLLDAVAGKQENDELKEMRQKYDEMKEQMALMMKLMQAKSSEDEATSA